jgi:hypothetical protein
MGAHTTVEQRDFPEPLGRFNQRNRRFPARRRDGAEANGAGEDAINAIARIAAVDTALAAASNLTRDDASTAC